MSGNGPLVDILREALALDSASRTGRKKDSARREVRTFIQNIHRFVEDNLEHSDPPYEHAIVFDEAQRAWNADQNRWKYRKKSERWHIPEPQMIFEIMDRHQDWAVVVALVGGGQEIHQGEAGLAEWGRVGAMFPKWKIVASPEAINGGQSVAGSLLFENSQPNDAVTLDPALHLSICVRSHRAQTLAEWGQPSVEQRNQWGPTISRGIFGLSACVNTRLDRGPRLAANKYEGITEVWSRCKFRSRTIKGLRLGNV